MWIKPVFSGWDKSGTWISKFEEKTWDIDIETRGQWPYRLASYGNDPMFSHLTSYLKSETSIALTSMYILSLTAILMASEATLISKQPQQPQRFNLKSDL